MEFKILRSHSSSSRTYIQYGDYIITGGWIKEPKNETKAIMKMLCQLFPLKKISQTCVLVQVVTIFVNIIRSVKFIGPVTIMWPSLNLDIFKLYLS